MRLLNFFILCKLTFATINSHAFNLVDAYEAALMSDPTMQVAQAEYLVGLEAVKIARGGLLPQINITGSYQERDTDTAGTFPITLDQDQNPFTAEVRALRPVDNQSDETIETWNFSVRQALYDASQWFEYKRGKYQTEQARHQLKVEQQELLLRVISTYIEVLRAQDNLELAKRSESADKNQLSHSDKRAKVGINAKIDVYQAQSAYEVSIANRLNNEDLLGEAEDALQLITGGYGQTLWQLKSHFEPSPPKFITVEQWIESALTNNSNVKVARANKYSAKAAYRSARSRHLPTVYMEISYNDADSQTDEIDNGLPFKLSSITQGASLNVNATIPIYSGGSTSAKRRQTKYQHQQAEEEYQGTVEDIKRQIRVIHRRIMANIKRINVNNKMTSSTQQALQAIKKGYNTGISDINDLLNAQRNYYRALRDLKNTQYDYLIAMAELNFLSGQLSPAYIYELNNHLVKTE